MSLIEVKNVERVFTTGEIETRALAGVDLNIESGEFICLSGWSGSGKTTLLNQIGTLDTPTGGDVLIDGINPRDLSDKEKTKFRLNTIGFVFQAYNLVPVLTGYENAEMLLVLQGMPKAEREAIMWPLLEALGIKDLADKLPSQMSGGQQQRFAVARAIAPSPRIVLADEPTANLDSTSSEELLDLMEKMNQEKGITFVFSSHDDLIHNRAKRLIVMRDGKIIEDRDQTASKIESQKAE